MKLDIRFNPFDTFPADLVYKRSTKEVLKYMRRTLRRTWVFRVVFAFWMLIRTVLHFVYARCLSQYPFNQSVLPSRLCFILAERLAEAAAASDESAVCVELADEAPAAS